MDFYVWLQHICPEAGPAARNAAGVGPVGSRCRDTRGDADSPGGQACETRLPTNKKTPASPGDAGVMEWRRCVSAGEARPASTPIRVTMDCVVSRAVVLIRLTRFRSMLCLGRNLITVFQGVNTCAQLFSFSRPDLIATANTLPNQPGAPLSAKFGGLSRNEEKKTSGKRAFSSSGLGAPMMLRG